MSRIDELIAELCPDGVAVEWKALGEVAEIKRGTSITQTNVTPGDIPVIAGGRTPAYYHNASNRTGETIVIAGSGAYAGFVSWWDQPIFVSDAFTVKPHAELVPRYCFYWLEGMQQQLHELKSGGGVPHVYPRDVAPLQIPIPCPDNPQKSLEIQAEIVRILDTFTELTTELTAELTTELTARKKQYNYYRDQLLSFEEGEVEWKALGEVITALRTGLNPRENFKLNLQGAENYYVTVRELGGFEICISEKTDRIDDVGLSLIQNRSKLRVGDVLFSGTGTIGRTALVTETPSNWNVKEGVYVITPNLDHISARFLIHLLHSSSVRNHILAQADGSTVVSIPMAALRKVKIPVPSLAEQARIVAILDKFDALTNSITEGLPREIELRQKQYAYYRDKLLRFPDIKKG